MKERKFYIVARQEGSEWIQVGKGDLYKFLVAVARRIWSGRWPRRPQNLDAASEGTYLVEEVVVRGDCRSAQGEYYRVLECDDRTESRRVVLEVHVRDGASRVIVKRSRDQENVYRVYVV